jgi:hypothetical protein
MKPRNKYEKRVAELNATLSQDIAVKDVEWFKRVSKKWNFGGANFCYFTIHTNIKEFEVKRLYRGYKFTDKNTDHFFFVEIIRKFYDGERKTYFAKQRQMGGYYDCFTYSSSIELRSVYKNYAGYDITDLFSLSSDSRSQSIGKRVPCERRDPKELARVICNNPVAETMYKENNPMFGYLLWRTHLKDTCRAYTIAKRHGFVFDRETTPLWIDMVFAMIKCGKDWHNPVYVAPKDLRATHDRFIHQWIRKKEMAEIIRKNRKAEARLRTEADAQTTYEKARKRFFGMELKSGSLVVSVLPNIESFKEMAEHFHNCVFSNNYWDMKKHPKSLIMVACIAGNKAELMEIDLEDYTIRQCFGKYNQFSNYHDKIVGFVKKQMKTIKAYNENKGQIKKAA